MNAACRTCGQLNPPDARTCQYCGASLPSTPALRDPFRTRPDRAWGATNRWGDPLSGPAPRPAGLKEPGVGLLLELLPGLVGFLGIGYIWAGEVALGVGLLLGYWVVGALLVLLTVASLGTLFCCFPIFILYYPGVPIISALVLHSRLQRRQQQLVGTSVGHYPY